MPSSPPRFHPESNAGDIVSPRCPVCGRDLLAPGARTVEPDFSILVCPDCGLGRTWPPLAADKIGSWYPEQYYGKGNVRFNQLFESLVLWFRRRRALVVHARVPRGPVIDVGCGRGRLLNFLRELGYEPRGFELSETAAWHARTNLKIPVAVEDFTTAKIEPGLCSAVIFWHSLEHFANPMEAIAKAYEALRPGGVLVIAVPNFGGWQARVFGRWWFHLDVPRHYFHFGVRALEEALSRHRFRIVQLDHFSFEQNPYGLLQSIYNALGFRYNLLYSLLKDPSARADSALRFPFQTLAVLLLLPLLLPLTLALILIETACRSGGTIEVYAFKE